MFFTKKSEKGASLKYLKKIRKKDNNKNNRHRKNSKRYLAEEGWLNSDNGREKTTIFKFPAFCKGQISE